MRWQRSRLGTAVREDFVELEGSKSALGADIAIATEGDEEIREAADQVLYIPPRSELLLPILEVVPCSCWPTTLPCDVDQPRNLPKSVTVE